MITRQDSEFLGYLEERVIFFILNGSEFVSETLRKRTVNMKKTKQNKLSSPCRDFQIVIQPKHETLTILS